MRPGNSFHLVAFLFLFLAQVTIGGIFHEIRRKISQRRVRHGPHGPMLENCNLCVWGSCTPGIQERKDHKFIDYIDVEDLKRAIRQGITTNKKTMTNILTTRTLDQRNKINQQFDQNQGGSLAKQLSEKLNPSYRFTELIVAMATPLPEYFAAQFQKAFDLQKFTNKDVQRTEGRRSVIEWFTTLPPCFIRKITRTYNKMYGTPRKEKTAIDHFSMQLETALVGFPKSDYIDVLLEMGRATRDDNINTSWFKALIDAYRMKVAIVTQNWRKKKAVFMEIFTKRSIPQLKETIAVYESFRTGSADFESLEKDIELHMESVTEIYKLMIEIIKKGFSYYAEGIKRFFGVYSNSSHSKFIAFIRARCDIDLGDIKKAYEVLYKRTIAVDFEELEVSRKEFYDTMMSILNPARNDLTNPK